MHQTPVHCWFVVLRVASGLPADRLQDHDGGIGPSTHGVGDHWNELLFWTKKVAVLFDFLSSVAKGGAAGCLISGVDV